LAMTTTSRLLLIGVISSSLLFVGLWQLEEMWNHQAWGAQNFTLPFGATATWWFARDIWYAFIVAGFTIVLWTMMKAKRFEV